MNSSPSQIWNMNSTYLTVDTSSNATYDSVVDRSPTRSIYKRHMGNQPINKRPSHQSDVLNTSVDHNIILCIYTVLTLETIASSMGITVIPMINSRLRLSNTAIGTISSVSSLLVLVCGLMLGKASDRYGKLQMLQLSAIAQAVGYFLLILSVTTNHFSFLLYVLSRFIPSIFKCTMVICQAYLVDSSSSPSQSVQRIGRLIAISNAVFVITPLIGGYISSYDILLPIKVGFAISSINCLILLLQRNPFKFNVKIKRSEDDNPSNKRINQDRHANRVIDFHEALFIKFIFQLGHMIYDTFYAQQLYSQLGLSNVHIGLFFSLSGILSTFANGFLIPYLHSNQCTVSTEESLVLAAIFQAIGLWLWGRNRPTIFTAILSTLIISITSNVFITICQSCIAVSPSIDRHGTGMSLSLSSTVDRGARSIGPILGGMVIHNFGFSSVGYLGSGISLLCSLILISTSSHIKFPSMARHLSWHWLKDYNSIIYRNE